LLGHVPLLARLLNKTSCDKALCRDRRFILHGFRIKNTPLLRGSDDLQQVLALLRVDLLTRRNLAVVTIDQLSELLLLLGEDIAGMLQILLGPCVVKLSHDIAPDNGGSDRGDLDQRAGGGRHRVKHLAAAGNQYTRALNARRNASQIPQPTIAVSNTASADRAAQPSGAVNVTK